MYLFIKEVQHILAAFVQFQPPWRKWALPHWYRASTCRISTCPI